MCYTPYSDRHPVREALLSPPTLVDGTWSLLVLFKGLRTTGSPDFQVLSKRTIARFITPSNPLKQDSHHLANIERLCTTLIVSISITNTSLHSPNTMPNSYTFLVQASTPSRTENRIPTGNVILGTGKVRDRNGYGK